MSARLSASRDDGFASLTAALAEVERPEPVSRIDRMVVRWASWYTRELPRTVGTDRVAEIDSDLFEHRTDGATSHAIVSRWVRGVPADLAWRLDQRRQAVTPEQRGTFPIGLPITASVVTAMLIAWGCLVSGRLALSVLRGEWSGAADLVLAVTLGTVIAVCGAIMTSRPAQRWVGALWLAVAAYLLVRFGMDVLLVSSVTIGAMYFTTDYPSMLSHGLTLAGVLFFSAMALWWFPPRREGSGGGAAA